MKRTYQDRLIAGLVALGATYVESRSGKYEAYYRQELSREGQKMYFFVGPNGALRKGHCASASFSIGDPQRPSPAYAQILSAGDKALGESKPKTQVFEGF